MARELKSNDRKKRNQFTGEWCSGGTSGSGTGNGMFWTPYGIALNASQNVLYVVDQRNRTTPEWTDPLCH